MNLMHSSLATCQWHFDKCSANSSMFRAASKRLYHVGSHTWIPLKPKHRATILRFLSVGSVYSGLLLNGCNHQPAGGGLCNNYPSLWECAHREQKVLFGISSFLNLSVTHDNMAVGAGNAPTIGLASQAATLGALVGDTFPPSSSTYFLLGCFRRASTSQIGAFKGKASTWEGLEFNDEPAADVAVGDAFEDSIVAEEDELRQVPLKTLEEDRTTATPWANYLALSDADLLKQCQMDTYRASGPGGQHRNKTESAVRLRHSPTGLTSQSCEQRSQHMNRGTALFRLRQAIALKVRKEVQLEGYQPGVDLVRILPNSAPSRRQLGTKQKIGPNHPDFLAGIRELLDVMAAAEGSVSAAATALGISTGALSKLITSDKNLLQEVNDLRSSKGLKSLR